MLFQHNTNDANVLRLLTSQSDVAEGSLLQIVLSGGLGGGLSGGLGGELSGGLGGGLSDGLGGGLGGVIGWWIGWCDWVVWFGWMVLLDSVVVWLGRVVDVVFEWVLNDDRVQFQ